MDEGHQYSQRLVFVWLVVAVVAELLQLVVIVVDVLMIVEMEELDVAVGMAADAEGAVSMFSGTFWF